MLMASKSVPLATFHFIGAGPPTSVTSFPKFVHQFVSPLLLWLHVPNVSQSSISFLLVYDSHFSHCACLQPLWAVRSPNVGMLKAK